MKNQLSAQLGKNRRFCFRCLLLLKRPIIVHAHLSKRTYKVFLLTRIPAILMCVNNGDLWLLIWTPQVLTRSDFF